MSFDLAAPRGVTLEAAADAVSLRIRWFKGMHLLVLLWLAGATYGFSQVDAAARNGGEATPWWAVLVVLAYYVAAGLLNHTRVDVSREGLTVTHGPLPWWPRTRRWPKGSFRTLHLSAGADASWADHSIRTADHRLYAALDGGRRVALLRGLARPEQAEYVARALLHFHLAPGGLRD